MPTLSRPAALAALLFLTLTGCGGAKDTGGEKPVANSSDADSLQGVWTLHGEESNGHTELIFADIMITFKGDKVELRQLGTDHQQFVTATFKLDPTKPLKEIDLTAGEAGKAETMLGIYDIKGSDLRICVGPGDAPRPTQFDSPKGVNSRLMIYKRGKTPPPTPSETDLKTGVVGKWFFVGGAEAFNIFSGETEFTADGRLLAHFGGTKPPEERFRYRVENSYLVLTPADKKGAEQRIWVTGLTPEFLVATTPRGRLRRVK